MYFKKFPLALQTIFSLHNFEADNFSQQLQLANNFFTKKVTPPVKEIMVHPLLYQNMREYQNICVSVRKSTRHWL